MADSQEQKGQPSRWDDATWIGVGAGVGATCGVLIGGGAGMAIGVGLGACVGALIMGWRGRQGPHQSR